MKIGLVDSMIRSLVGDPDYVSGRKKYEYNNMKRIVAYCANPCEYVRYSQRKSAKAYALSIRDGDSQSWYEVMSVVKVDNVWSVTFELTTAEFGQRGVNVKYADFSENTSVRVQDHLRDVATRVVGTKFESFQQALHVYETARTVNVKLEPTAEIKSLLMRYGFSGQHYHWHY